MIKSLPKSFEMKGAELPFYYNDDWITNGKFAVKRSLVKDSFKYCLDKPGVNQPDINRVIPTSQPIALTRTNKLYDMSGGDYARVFIDDSDNEYLVDEQYVKTFDLVIAFTTGDMQAITNGDISVVVMPMRHTIKEVKRKAA